MACGSDTVDISDMNPMTRDPIYDTNHRLNDRLNHHRLNKVQE
jgi:hypothetical protein